LVQLNYNEPQNHTETLKQFAKQKITH